jgi:hypothetical protein
MSSSKELFEDINIGDEFYRLYSGKKIHYEKCKVVDIIERNRRKTFISRIEYRIKGRSKTKIKWFDNISILLYTSVFFETKKDLLLFLDDKCARKICYPGISDQLKEELQAFKKKNPQNFI